MLDKRRRIIITLIVVALIGIGSMDRFMDGDNDGHGEGGKFGNENDTERESERFGGDDKNNDFGGGGGMEGAKENFVGSAVQLGLIVVGGIIIGALIQPKGIEIVKHTVMGANNKNINNKSEV